MIDPVFLGLRSRFFSSSGSSFINSLWMTSSLIATQKRTKTPSRIAMMIMRVVSCR